jgi:hypothetical protein
MKSIDEAAKVMYDDAKNIGAFINGAEFAQRWIPVNEELPIAYESGNWDGLRSEYILAKNIDGNWFKARIYQGVMDGFKYCDWVTESDTILTEIIYWRPIMHF